MAASLKTKIITAKLEETRAWYQRVFGLVVAEEWSEPGDKGLILAFPSGHGEALLEICLGAGTHDFSGVSLQFRVPDIEAFRKSLPGDLAYAGPNRRPWGSVYLYLRDPNDIAIAVIEG